MDLLDGIGGCHLTNLWAKVLQRFAFKSKLFFTKKTRGCNATFNAPQLRIGMCRHIQRINKWARDDVTKEDKTIMIRKKNHYTMRCDSKEFTLEDGSKHQLLLRRSSLDLYYITTGTPQVSAVRLSFPSGHARMIHRVDMLSGDKQTLQHNYKILPTQQTQRNGSDKLNKVASMYLAAINL